MKATTTVEVRFIRIRAVERKIGCSRWTIYRMARAGQFPASIKIGERASAWLESEVDQWIADRTANHRTPTRPSAEARAAA